MKISILLKRKLRKRQYHLIEAHKSVLQNLSKDEFIALQSLSKNRDLIIQKSDKCNSVIIVDSNNYIEKMDTILGVKTGVIYGLYKLYKTSVENA